LFSRSLFVVACELQRECQRGSGEYEVNGAREGYHLSCAFLKYVFFVKTQDVTSSSRVRVWVACDRVPRAPPRPRLFARRSSWLTRSPASRLLLFLCPIILRMSTRFFYFSPSCSCSPGAAGRGPALCRGRAATARREPGSQRGQILRSLAHCCRCCTCCFLSRRHARAFPTAPLP
jgi:hypothetical protein